MTAKNGNSWTLLLLGNWRRSLRRSSTAIVGTSQLFSCSVGGQSPVSFDLHVCGGLYRQCCLLSVLRLADRASRDSRTQGGIAWNLFWKSTDVTEHCHASFADMEVWGDTSVCRGFVRLSDCNSVQPSIFHNHNHKEVLLALYSLRRAERILLADIGQFIHDRPTRCEASATVRR